MALRNLITPVHSLTPLSRLIAADALLLPTSVWISFWLRLAHPFAPAFSESFWLLLAAPIIGLPVFILSGQYKSLTRYAGSSAFYRLAGRNCLVVLLLAFTGLLLGLPQPPRSSWILVWLLLTCFTGALRFALRDYLLIQHNNPRQDLTHVAIYGAGAAGVQLSVALRLAGTHSVQFFVDDAPDLWNRNINGVPIHSPLFLRQSTSQISQVLLAIPSLSRRRRRRLITDLQELGIPVLQVPSVDDITSGRARIDALRPIPIEDLLGRDPVIPNPHLLGPGITGLSLCVTGAAGSIGSELCRQILRHSPRSLLLLDHSESSLYAIEQELKTLLMPGVEMEVVIGSATDLSLLQSLFSKHKVNVVFHAAAYKHVPLVESNPLAGLANNVLSTRAVCLAACSAGVNDVVLISTDKAVRPTSVMGASKRLAELVVQAHAHEVSSHHLKRENQSSPRFSMVRFGNVLGSSGSVVPLFRQQIAAGGPITLTHPDIIRYFMTIHEAAQLVLQASVLAHGGDVFLLDMGEPVRIYDLALQMIRLSGLSVRDAQHPNGDIEIVCTGLRTGEKLYEELLIDAESAPTEHTLIYRAHERSVAPSQLWPQIDALAYAIENQDLSAAFEVLSTLVPEWTWSGSASSPTRESADL